MMKSKVVGVLALQGDFAKHIEMIRSIGARAKEVRKAEDLDECDGLIIPGGESTVMLRQMDFMQIKEALAAFAKEKPVFGTCAGLILMSKEIQKSKMEPFKLLDVVVERNAFGRQIESFVAPIEVQISPQHVKVLQAYFIRAPRIRAVSPDVQVLATYKGEPVLVRQGHYLGASFHPELTTEPAIHQYFLDML